MNGGVSNPKYIYLYFKITSFIFSFNGNSLGNPGQLEYDLVSQLDITPLRAAFKWLILVLRIPRPLHIKDNFFQFLMCYLVRSGCWLSVARFNLTTTVYYIHFSCGNRHYPHVLIPVSLLYVLLMNMRSMLLSWR